MLNTIPIFDVYKIEINESAQTADFYICGTLPSGCACPRNFVLKFNPCKPSSCLGYAVRIIDTVGTIYTVVNRCGNNLLLSQAVAQCIRFGKLHCTLSVDYDNYVLSQDKVLNFFTPITTSTASTSGSADTSSGTDTGSDTDEEEDDTQSTDECQELVKKLRAKNRELQAKNKELKAQLAECKESKCYAPHDAE